MKCCGLVDGPSDWTKIPESCRCNATETDCTSNAIYKEVDIPKYCSDKIINLMEQHMEVVLGIAFAIAIL
ncbi:hypothetical protein KUCAC02_032904, partial [Chaenocephalus aceratus]